MKVRLVFKDGTRADVTHVCEVISGDNFVTLTMRDGSTQVYEAANYLAAFEA